ncbi:hypothetical protein BC834DRAFT_471423 [Gloeopeniophorella convolvens]|nr:hypothetical protein BC834DRAFT_471423 [Gloeopeniophorella convolvens]
MSNNQNNVRPPPNVHLEVSGKEEEAKKRRLEEEQAAADQQQEQLDREKAEAREHAKLEKEAACKEKSREKAKNQAREREEKKRMQEAENARKAQQEEAERRRRAEEAKLLEQLMARGPLRPHALRPKPRPVYSESTSASQSGVHVHANTDMSFHAPPPPTLPAPPPPPPPHGITAWPAFPTGSSVGPVRRRPQPRLVHPGSSHFMQAPARWSFSLAAATAPSYPEPHRPQLVHRDFALPYTTPSTQTMDMVQFEQHLHPHPHLPPSTIADQQLDLSYPPRHTSLTPHPLPPSSFPPQTALSPSLAFQHSAFSDPGMSQDAVYDAYDEQTFVQ